MDFWELKGIINNQDNRYKLGHCPGQAGCRSMVTLFLKEIIQ